jgi:pimeloyl-ACP methyl ester carboxylesterase
MTNLYFQERGRGIPVILLHGFPFQQTIWDSFAEKLSKSFRVFTVDLPGFGKSPILDLPFTVDEVGQQIIAWIEENDLHNCALVGHSLGGYVALSVAFKKPDLLSSLVLFHSTAYPDSIEKKMSRNKVLEFIDKNGVKAFTSNFIGPLFADQQHPSIRKVKAIAMEANAAVVTGYTQAMRDRPERINVLRSFIKPALIIGGEKDAGISIESIQEQASVCSSCEIHILKQVAHMGMFENEIESLAVLQSFISKASVTK